MFNLFKKQKEKTDLENKLNETIYALDEIGLMFHRPQGTIWVEPDVYKNVDSKFINRQIECITIHLDLTVPDNGSSIEDIVNNYLDEHEKSKKPIPLELIYFIDYKKPSLKKHNETNVSKELGQVLNLIDKKQTSLNRKNEDTMTHKEFMGIADDPLSQLFYASIDETFEKKTRAYNHFEEKETFYDTIVHHLLYSGSMTKKDGMIQYESNNPIIINAHISLMEKEVFKLARRIEDIKNQLLKGPNKTFNQAVFDDTILFDPKAVAAISKLSILPMHSLAKNIYDVHVLMPLINDVIEVIDQASSHFYDEIERLNALSEKTKQNKIKQQNAKEKSDIIALLNQSFEDLQTVEKPKQ